MENIILGIKSKKKKSYAALLMPGMVLGSVGFQHKILDADNTHSEN